jgi:hypothetical protein
MVFIQIVHENMCSVVCTVDRRDMTQHRHDYVTFAVWNQEDKLTEVIIRVYLYLIALWMGGARWRSWLRHYATNRNVAGSIPDGVIGINSLT